MYDIVELAEQGFRDQLSGTAHDIPPVLEGAVDRLLTTLRVPRDVEICNHLEEDPGLPFVMLFHDVTLRVCLDTCGVIVFMTYLRERNKHRRNSHCAACDRWLSRKNTAENWSVLTVGAGFVMMDLCNTCQTRLVRQIDPAHPRFVAQASRRLTIACPRPDKIKWPSRSSAQGELLRIAMIPESARGNHYPIRGYECCCGSWHTTSMTEAEYEATKQ